MLDRFRRIFLALLFLGTPLAFYMRASDGFTLPKEIVSGTALAVLLGSLSLTEWKILSRSWLIRIAFLFLGWMLADSFGVGLLKMEVLKGSIHLWILVGSLAAVVYACGRGQSYEKLLHYSLLAGALTALYGLSQSLGLDQAHWDGRFESRAFSTLGNPNYLGGHLVALLPVSFILILRSRQRTGWLWWRAVTLILFAGLLFTRVRGAEIAMGASALFLGLAFFSSGGKLLARENFRFLLVSLGVFLAAGGAFVARHGGFSSFGFSQVSVQQRWDTYRVALEMVKDHPWNGIGLGQLGLQFPRYQSKPFSPDHGEEHPYIYTEHVHNEFLQFLVEGGFPGLFLFMALLSAFAVSWFRFMRNPRGDLDSKELLIGIGAGVVALLVQSLSNFPLQIAPTAVVFGLFLAAPLALGGASPVPASKIGFIPKAGAGLLLGAVIIAGIRAMGSSIAFRDTVGETSLGKAQNAVYYGNRLVGLAPWNPKAWAASAKALELAKMKDLSLEAFQKAYGLNPNDVQSQVDAADLLAQQGKLQEAIDLCRNVETTAPNFIGPLWIEAYAYFNLKQYSQASVYFEKFTRYDPHNDQAYTALGVSYLKEGRRTEAKAALEEAVGINPANQEAAGFLKALK